MSDDDVDIALIDAGLRVLLWVARVLAFLAVVAMLSLAVLA